MFICLPFEPLGCIYTLHRRCYGQHTAGTCPTVLRRVVAKLQPICFAAVSHLPPRNSSLHPRRVCHQPAERFWLQLIMEHAETIGSTVAQPLEPPRPSAP
jgi:hypothetical protein